MTNRIIITIMTLCFFMAGYGQTNQQEFRVPLSDPNSPGKLSAKTHRGSIRVAGHSGKEVIISVIPMEEEEDKGSMTRDGLRRVPNTGAKFNIIEDNNFVQITGVENKRIDFDIKVPNQFSLMLKTHHDGYIEVKNVEGEIEVDGHHEDILLENVGGSVIADTHHGEIKVTLSSIKAGAPMAFSTYHGDIDVTFPGSVNASVKVKTTKGDIYTDFDLQLEMESAEVESGVSGGTKIEVGGWLNGALGRGGPEFLFNTYHGDVILRGN